jgi:hypothetical protein
MDRPEEKEVPSPYVISTHIGKGSFADVYKGYHEVHSIAFSAEDECLTRFA